MTARVAWLVLLTGARIRLVQYLDLRTLGISSNLAMVAIKIGFEVYTELVGRRQANC